MVFMSSEYNNFYQKYFATRFPHRKCKLQESKQRAKKKIKSQTALITNKFTNTSSLNVNSRVN